MSKGRAQVLARISGERERQIEKFGPQTDISLSRLANILTEEVGEVAMEVNDILEETDKWAQTRPPLETQTEFLRKHSQELETELIQSAACCLKMIEALQNGSYHLG